MRIVFAGTPAIAVPSLELLAKDYEILVLTNPDRPKGRGKKMIYSAVKEKALELELPMVQPEKLDEDLLRRVKDFQGDLLVCIAYGKIFKQQFLDLFPLGGINLHPSRLPELRGPSPLSAAISAGLECSAITVQRLALKMDSGDILVQQDLSIDSRETTQSLTEKVAEMGAPLLLKVVQSIQNGSYSAVPQKENQASYCRLLQKIDGQLDWQQSAEKIDRQIRACSPWPGAFTHWGGQQLYIRQAIPYEDPKFLPQGQPGRVLGVDKKAGILVETGRGILAAQRLQLQSRKNLDFLSFLNGNKELVNSQLGE
ncbi:MAG: methionyl-tRNA formyltransferase [Spirochaetaceae bacterium]|jgi:methionyl-tRNA formyltransferase|nr:methionyl-tRNA formyltransferase [Spirochaetaceae bacterium]